ncbi:MAG: hypothetical protein ABIN91_22225 [Mucilaginibacter sp.]|uniref:hypothetical protein n=1 Tax=Mucilaginibacter sp. TaxID=1882438 RepID=UPI00326504AE
MKQKLIYAIVGMLLIGCIVSCKKNDDKVIPSSSLTIVNTVAGATALVTNFDSNSKLTFYKTAQQITAYNSALPFTEFSSYMGTYPLGISLLTDTLHTIYKGDITIEPGSIHSLFLTGTLTAVDTIYTTDKIPNLLPVDSLADVRFVNASKGSLPISVNIKNQATPFIPSLPYKGVSAFADYSFKKVVPAITSYIFEIRDVATNKVLVTYTLNASTVRLGKSISVALRGLPGGTGVNVQAASIVNHY